MITRPRLVMIMSFSTGGSPRSSNFGIVVVMTRSTMPTLACCTKALHAEAPDARRVDGEVALLGRLELGRLLVVHDRARELHGVRGRERLVLDTGVILPSILIAGGKPTVMKRSEPFLREHQPQQVVHEFGCLFAFHDCLSDALNREVSPENFGFGRARLANP